MEGRWRQAILGVALLLSLTACTDQPWRARSAITPGPLATAVPEVTAPGSATPSPSVAALIPPALSFAPTAVPTVDPTLWQGLEARPLRFPTLNPGESCPRTGGAQVDPGYGAALGDGPIYPVYGRDGLLSYRRADIDRQAGVYWMKTLWIASPAYKAPAIVRGRQIDGPQPLRFQVSPHEPTMTLRFETETGVRSDGSARGWRDRPSLTAIPGPGCFAFQVDGEGFTEIIVFEVRVQDTP